MTHRSLLVLSAVLLAACGPERRTDDRGRDDKPASKCGNDVREAGEACDGADLADTTCESLDRDPGELRCLADCTGFDTTFCKEDPSCVPDCTGRTCGLDPVCGTSCGECSGADTCSNDGTCQACQPDCGERQCGVEPVCGTSCGTCEGTDTCSAAGVCEACVPDCTGLQCGVDPVCGVACGFCTQVETCRAGQCECVPQCGERECGVDPVCGESCGTCPGTEVCGDDGMCQGGCSSDADCAGGWCHPQKRVCVPADKLGLCDACETDDQCGLEGDDCMRITTASDGTFVEQVCGTSCATNDDCLKGYSCFDGQCYPVPGGVVPHSCKSIADFLNGTFCIPGLDMCGAPDVNDGTCTGSSCSVGCATSADCPGETTCEERSFAKFCTLPL